MKGKKVSATTVDGKRVKGKVVLIYEDAVTSGVDNYVSITMLSVKDKHKMIHNVRPRDVISFGKKKDKINAEM
jgi:hypothetical protein